MRLVLIVKDSYKVFENRVCLAEYLLSGANTPTKEEIEFIRTQEYKEKA